MKQLKRLLITYSYEMYISALLILAGIMFLKIIERS